MKKVFKIALFAGVTAMVAACTKDNSADVAQSQGYRTTNITIEGFAGEAASRTSMDTEHKRLVWSETESAIAAIELAEDEFTGVNLNNDRVGKGECAEVVDGKATFNATVKAAREGEYTRGYLAVYPYESFNSLNGTTLEVTMPAEQTPAAVNDIDAAATLLFASDLEGYEETPSNLALRFKHIAAYSSIRIKNLALNEGEDIAEIVITSNEEDKPLAGAWGFDFTSEKLAGDFGEETSQSITLDVSDLDLEAAQTAEGVNVFFGALPCGELHDLTVLVTTTEGRRFEKVITGANLTFETAYVEPFSVNFDNIDPKVILISVKCLEANAQGWLPVAFDNASLPETITTHFYVLLSEPAPEDVTIPMSSYYDPETIENLNLQFVDNNSVNVKRGETKSDLVAVSFNRSSFTGQTTDAFAVMTDYTKWPEGYKEHPDYYTSHVWIHVNNNFTMPYNMTEDMFVDAFSIVNGDFANLIDGNTDTYVNFRTGIAMGSWARYAYMNFAPSASQLGFFFDIKLPKVYIENITYTSQADNYPVMVGYATSKTDTVTTTNTFTNYIDSGFEGDASKTHTYTPNLSDDDTYFRFCFRRFHANNGTWDANGNNAGNDCRIAEVGMNVMY